MEEIFGRNSKKPLEPLNSKELEVCENLQADVEFLTNAIGQRNLLHYTKFLDTVRFLQDSFIDMGYNPYLQEYSVGGVSCFNVEAEVKASGSSDEIIVIGAHYDTVLNSPGAADNASAIAAVLAFARSFINKKLDCSVRFVCFANEEVPYFGSETMGSLVYAKSCKEKKEKIIAMMSMEMIGVKTIYEGSSSSLFPDEVRTAWPKGENLVAFTGNEFSKEIVKKALLSFQSKVSLLSLAGIFPETHEGVSWSDHRSFWKYGYAAMLVIDTASFWYPFYHRPTDTAEKLDYPRLTRIVSGLEAVIENLACFNF